MNNIVSQPLVHTTDAMLLWHLTSRIEIDKEHEEQMKIKNEIHKRVYVGAESEEASNASQEHFLEITWTQRNNDNY